MTNTSDPTPEKESDLRYAKNLTGVDWNALRLDLIADNFHNGRTTEQLRKSFENSSHCAMAWHNTRCIGNARALSDGVGNAYVIDVWTHSSFRSKGIGTRLMQLLLDELSGQHIYLQTDSAVEFYKKLGFEGEPEGLSKIVGEYLSGASL